MLVEVMCAADAHNLFGRLFGPLVVRKLFTQPVTAVHASASMPYLHPRFGIDFLEVNALRTVNNIYYVATGQGDGPANHHTSSR